LYEWKMWKQRFPLRSVVRQRFLQEIRMSNSASPPTWRIGKRRARCTASLSSFLPSLYTTANLVDHSGEHPTHRNATATGIPLAARVLLSVDTLPQVRSAGHRGGVSRLVRLAGSRCIEVVMPKSKWSIEVAKTAHMTNRLPVGLVRVRMRFSGRRPRGSAGAGSETVRGSVRAVRVSAQR
jgi:hypothetical protein